jgi:hypothetical protein
MQIGRISWLGGRPEPSSLSRGDTVMAEAGLASAPYPLMHRLRGQLSVDAVMNKTRVS